MVKKLFALSIFLMAGNLPAQRNQSLDISMGAVVNTFLKKEETFLDDGYERKYNYSNAPGYFFKLAYEKKPFSKYAWNLVIPFGLSFIYQVNKYRYENYNVGRFWGPQIYYNQVTEKMIHLNLFAGLAVRHQSDSWRFSGNISINMCYSFKYLETKENNTGIDESHSGSGIHFLSSAQVSTLYRLNNKLWIGPSLESFLYNIPYFIHQVRSRFKGPEYGPVIPDFSLTGRNLWINPGIKIQLDLK